MPTSPRPPRRPQPPRPPRIRPIRLQPLRSAESVELDGRRNKAGQFPPFVRWDHFLARFTWRSGEHLTTIAPTGAGKTLLNRELLQHAPIDWVVVFGIKRRDTELYGPFKKLGYEQVGRFDPDERFEGVMDDRTRPYRVLLIPRTDKPGVEGERVKEKTFRNALHDIEETGDWVLYVDDVIYVSRDLKLRDDLNVLWQVGRSEGISVVASAQEPVNIPVTAYGSATHLFIFKNPDMHRVRRLGELTGFNRDVAFDTILQLPKHEFLYINKDSGDMMRSKVLQRGPKG